MDPANNKHSSLQLWIELQLTVLVHNTVLVYHTRSCDCICSEIYSALLNVALNVAWDKTETSKIIYLCESDTNILQQAFTHFSPVVSVYWTVTIWALWASLLSVFCEEKMRAN